MVTIDEVNIWQGSHGSLFLMTLFQHLQKGWTAFLHMLEKLDELTVSGSDTPKVPLLRNVFREDSNPTSTGTYTKKNR